MSLTPKQEKFAQEVASGKSQADAYLAAFNCAKSKPETVIQSASVPANATKEIPMNRDQFSQYERLKVVMEDWANWCKGYMVNNGWPSRSVGVESGYGSSCTFDDLCDSVDREVNRKIDAAVDDLDEGKKAAVYRCYGLSSVFRFPRGNYDELVISAHDDLLASLPRKGVSI